MTSAAVDGDTVGRGQLDEAIGALEAFVAALDHNGDLGVLLQQVVEQVVQVVPEADMASVTLFRQGRPETAACTDDRVYNIDLDQYRAGVGPCLQAAETGKIVRVAAEQVRQQWPGFVQSAVDAGVDSYLSAPLVVDEQHSGALNLYGTRPHGYAETDGSLLELYLTAVEGALRANVRYRNAQQLADQLREAMESRAVIEQAKGMIMGARRITSEQAFDVLVEQSQRENTKLREIAERFVAAVVAEG